MIFKKNNYQTLVMYLPNRLDPKKGYILGFQKKYIFIMYFDCDKDGTLLDT
jgi:hypothetical protein